MAQLQFHYGYEGLRPGQRALLDGRPRARGGAAARGREATLDLPAGLRAETDDVWIAAESQLALAPRSPSGTATTSWASRSTAPRASPRRVRVTPRTVRLSPERVDPGFVSQLLYPAEPPLPAGSPVRADPPLLPGARGVACWATGCTG